MCFVGGRVDCVVWVRITGCRSRRRKDAPAKGTDLLASHEDGPRLTRTNVIPFRMVSRFGSRRQSL
jgi:hypothetical protein